MTAKNEPENNGKTADNAFEINCDRVKVTAFTLPLHQPRPGYSRGTAFAAGRTNVTNRTAVTQCGCAGTEELATSFSFAEPAG